MLRNSVFVSVQRNSVTLFLFDFPHPLGKHIFRKSPEILEPEP